MNRNTQLFEAETVMHALALVRESLGPGARILDTRRVEAGGFLGLGAPRVRVTAEPQDNGTAPDAFPSGEERVPVAPAGSLAAALEEAGMSAAGAAEFGRGRPLSALNTAEFGLELRSAIVTCDPLETAGVTVLAGPTGVGKTTTAAKLAAISSLSLGRSVALISMDAFRVGAMDQLKTYAELLNVPFETAFTPQELALAARRHASCHTVIVDTAGHSPYNEARMKELAQFLGALRGARVLLTLSAAQAPEASRLWRRFSAFGPCGLVVTKLDETPRLWGLAEIQRSTGLPLAFTTNGQGVPEDIEKADAASLAALLLGSLEDKE